MIMVQIVNKLVFIMITIIFLFGLQVLSVYKLIFILFIHQFFKLNIKLFTFLKNNYEYYYNYDKYNQYNNYLNKYVDIKLKNNTQFEGKLINVRKTKIHFYDIEEYNLIFFIFLKKNINIQYTINLNSIQYIKSSKNNQYKILLDELFDKSIFFKRLDIYLKKSIKDFLYINNND
jgi:small nuclear ribonucleoprotein (snRNP)-like protein